MLHAPVPMFLLHDLVPRRVANHVLLQIRLLSIIFAVIVYCVFLLQILNLAIIVIIGIHQIT
jgi:hypothetical protein